MAAMLSRPQCQNDLLSLAAAVFAILKKRQPEAQLGIVVVSVTIFPFQKQWQHN